LLDCTFLAILRQSQKPAFHCGVRVQPRPIRAQPAACYRTLESPCNTLRRPRARRNTPLEGSSTCADHTTTNKIRSGRRPAVEQPRFRGSNRMLPKNGGRSHQYAPENTRPKIRARKYAPENAARAGPGRFRPRPHRRRPDSRGSTSSEPKKAPRLLAGLVAWQAHSANLRPERINRARRRHADLTDQGGAAISFATHATVVVIDEESRNPIELSIALRGEPRPIRRKRTTGTASPAYRRPTIERVNGIEHHRPKHLRAVHHAASHGGTAAIFVESPCESPDRSSRNSWPKDS